MNYNIFGINHNVYGMNLTLLGCSISSFILSVWENKKGLFEKPPIILHEEGSVYTYQFWDENGRIREQANKKT
jgi:hypothetical protein